MHENIKITYATLCELESWIRLINIVRWNFPGLSTQEEIDGYRETVEKNINRKSALCALDGSTVISFLLFSTKYNMLCHMAVHPDYRRKGIIDLQYKLTTNSRVKLTTDKISIALSF